jgi:endonuclease III
MPVNKYEKMEKARFYLEQEALDLDQMLLEFNAAKDEVDEFIRKKVNLNTIKASGVTRFLQNIIRDTKAQFTNTSTVLENGKI